MSIYDNEEREEAKQLRNHHEDMTGEPLAVRRSARQKAFRFARPPAHPSPLLGAGYKARVSGRLGEREKRACPQSAIVLAPLCTPSFWGAR